MYLDKNITLKGIADTLGYWNCCPYGSAEIVIDALELENVIYKKKIYGDLSSLGGAHRYLYSINNFKIHQKWDIENSEIDYGERIKNDVYLYYCFKGMEVEKQITGKEVIMEFLRGEELSEAGIDHMWRKAHSLFFGTYKKIMQLSEYIPEELDEVICKAVREFKWDYEMNKSEYYNPESLLFLYGFLSDLTTLAENEKPKESDFPF